MSLNINIGLLGHVDSGKTSLSKALSKISSTAAFDKNPQSQERGITLDLGFSALTLNVDEELNEDCEHKTLVFTFVDCPGHQSLIKTIIGGSSIIDMMLLVVDIQKGFETQTGECLIIGEIIKKPMIIVLNKIDMIEEPKRDITIEKMKKKVQKTLNSTIFKSSSIIPISATLNINIDLLKIAMVQEVKKMKLERSIDDPFIFAFDHCFSIKGSGTVLSGTILSGSIKVNDTIEIPQFKTDRKIKSMQMFKKPVNLGAVGDRVGICVTNFDSKLLERGLVCQKGCVQSAFAVIIKVHRVRHYKRDIKTKSKFHCSVGHETVMGRILIFSTSEKSDFDMNSTYNYEETLNESCENEKTFFALIEFEHSVMIHDKMMLIASKLDTEQTNVCRIAFHGKISAINSSSDKNYEQSFLPNINIYKLKTREGGVQRVVNDYEVITSNLFKKETDRSKFVGMKCLLSTGEAGAITGTFGQSAKVKIQFTAPLRISTLELLKNPKNDVKIYLSFKKFIFDKNHRMVQ